MSIIRGRPPAASACLGAGPPFALEASRWLEAEEVGAGGFCAAQLAQAYERTIVQWALACACYGVTPLHRHTAGNVQTSRTLRQGIPPQAGAPLERGLGSLLAQLCASVGGVSPQYAFHQCHTVIGAVSLFSQLGEGG